MWLGLKLLSPLRWYSKPRTEFKKEFKWTQNLKQKNWKPKTKDIGKQITKTLKEENRVLPKEQVENADFHKPIQNKIITTPE